MDCHPSSPRLAFITITISPPPLQAHASLRLKVLVLGSTEMVKKVRVHLFIVLERYSSSTAQAWPCHGDSHPMRRVRHRRRSPIREGRTLRIHYR